ncbi:MAG TPA: hypothetical protein VHZ07_12470 [Bryobacteraceae bacterium]|jgi:hypothetical protein|nr:hypothetical protein [Bryobacteraceae bacterium]
MIKQLALEVAMWAMLMQPALANPIPRRAVITGGGHGRCTIEVIVDGASEVDVSGDVGLLRTLSGQPAVWRRFECSAPLPTNPVDFRFVGIDGRGTVRLLGDPRRTGGRAVIHINDPGRGRGTYRFDLQWRGGGGWAPGPPHSYPTPSPGHGPSPGHLPVNTVIRACQDSVTKRLNRDGFQYINFERTIPNNNPGRNDLVTGSVSGKRRFETVWFSFSCSVDFISGHVRSVDVSPR